MKHINYIVTFFIACAYTAPTLTRSMSNDEQAYAYCLEHKKSFIAIIWPIAQGKDEKIQELLNKYGHIEYQKQRYFTWPEALSVLQKAHKKISNLNDHVAWYFPYGTFSKKARIFVVTFNNVATAIKAKMAIRKLYELEYRPVHINDTHAETIELAEFFFKQSQSTRRAFTAYAATIIRTKSL